MKKITILLLAITFSTASYSQLTNDNFQQAINACLTSSPEDGLCLDSDYGTMPDWNVSNVTDMNSAFSNRVDFNGDISAWDVSNVTNMKFMFNTASAFNGDISAWDVSSVNDMGNMFKDAITFNQFIGDWDTSSVIDMGGMFGGATAFNRYINDWNTSSVNLMNYMFSGASAFNQPLNDWDTSSVTLDCQVSDICGMEGMFFQASAFNQPLNNWNTSNVTNMDYMFQEASSFNQNLSSWCVTNVTDGTGAGGFGEVPTQFSFSSSLSESNKPVWGTCPTAGVDDQNQLDISIYPNPTSDMVYIEGNYTQLKAVVYDILGKQVMNKSITNTIDISHLDKGVYILQLSDGVKLSTRKIIKN